MWVGESEPGVGGLRTGMKEETRKRIHKGEATSGQRGKEVDPLKLSRESRVGFLVEETLRRREGPSYSVRKKHEGVENRCEKFTL